jgi:hypothetical protein
MDHDRITLTSEQRAAEERGRFAAANNDARAHLHTLPLGWSAMVLLDAQEATSPGWLLLPPGQWPPPGVAHILFERSGGEDIMSGTDMMPIADGDPSPLEVE